MIRKYVFNSIQVVGVDSKSRRLAVMVKLTFHGNYKMLIINVYMPCSEPGQEYQSAVVDCFGFIENCIVSNDYNAVMALGNGKFFESRFSALTQCRTGVNVSSRSVKGWQKFIV